MANEGKLVKLEFPPGFARRGTAYEQQGRWREGNMVRFSGSDLESIAGWLGVVLLNVSNTTIDLDGTVRSAFAWRDNLSRVWIAIGTTKKLYTFDGTTVYDVTPSGIVLPGEDVGNVYGYGTGQYNTGDYNEPVGSGATSNSNAAKVYGYWHLDNWGENLLASIDSDGRLVEWNPNTPATIAAVVSNAPEYMNGFVVTDEYHVIAIGAKIDIGGGSFRPAPRRVSWCTQQNNTVWAPDVLNLAGDLDLQTNGVGMRGIRFGRETLIFTDADVHRAVWVNYPNVYRFEKIADDCGLACPGAVAAGADRLFWVGPRGFYSYDGNQVRPVFSELFDTAGEGASLVSRNAKLTVGHNKLRNEFVIHYSTTETGNPDRYILWNYLEEWWVDGQLDRSCWYDSTLLDYPLAAQPFLSDANPKSRLYKHELGESRPNYSVIDSATSAPIEIGDGDRFMEVDQVVQDSDEGAARLRVGFDFFKAPNLAPLKTVAPTALDLVRGYTDVRGEGRAMAIRITTADAGGGTWRAGKWRVRAREGGRR